MGQEFGGFLRRGGCKILEIKLNFRVTAWIYGNFDIR